MTVEEFREQATLENGLFLLRESGVDEDGSEWEETRYFQDSKGLLPLSLVDTDARWRASRPDKPPGSQQPLRPFKLDHPARFVAVFVDALDKEGWAELGVEINGDPLGAPAYHPRALLCVWLYGFMTGVRSCRKLEAACRDQIPCLWLTGKPASLKNSCLISLPAARCRETAGRRTAGERDPASP